MKKLTGEQITAIASAYAIEIAKCSSLSELNTYRNFFLAVSNNLLTIVLEKNNTTTVKSKK